MPYYSDLHIHSYYSEGALSPAQIITRAKAYGIKVLALTDHNCIDGVLEIIALGKRRGVKIIPGVEIYTNYKGKNLHLLGYGFNLKKPKLNTVLKKLQEKRSQDVYRTISKLARRGFYVNSFAFRRLKTKYISAGQIIGILNQCPKNRKIIKKDCKTKNPDLFTIINKYFAKNGLTPLPETSLPTDKAIKLVKQAGGIAVLAHPGQQLLWEDDHLIVELKAKGLAGLEVLSPYHNWYQVEHYQSLAKKHKLIITAGSDFHGDLLGENLIKNQWIYFRVPNFLIKNV